jgi:hypothetical protein
VSSPSESSPSLVCPWLQQTQRRELHSYVATWWEGNFIVLFKILHCWVKGCYGCLIFSYYYYSNGRYKWLKKHLVPKIKLLLVQEGSNYVVENTHLLAIDLNWLWLIEPFGPKFKKVWYLLTILILCLSRMSWTRTERIST